MHCCRNTLIALAALLVPLGSAQAYTITPNTSTTDWVLATLPGRANLGHVIRDSSHRGAYVWQDASSDASSSDITAFYVTSDSTNLYFRIDFRSGTLGAIGGGGAPIVEIAIDRTLNTSGLQYFCNKDANSTYRTSPSAEWEYLVQINFGDTTQWVHSGACSSRLARGSQTLTSNVMESSVPWSAIGGVPSGPLRFTVLSGTAQNSQGGLNSVHDAVTNCGHPSITSCTSELSDSDVDYYFDIWFFDYYAGALKYEPAPPIAITEVFRGAAQANNWVEVLNRSGRELSLSGWEIGDEEDPGEAGEGMHTFPAVGQIPAGHAQVVAYSATAYNTTYSKLPNYEIGAVHDDVPDMGNDTAWGDSGGADMNLEATDEVLLLDPSYTIVDKLSYSSLVTTSSLSRQYTYRDTDLASDFTARATPNPGVGEAVCDDYTGSTDLPNGTPCNAGNLCLTQTCTAGACTGGTTRVCASDGNQCTSDACAPDLLGCAYPPEPDNVECTDSSPNNCYRAECNGAGACDQQGGFESIGTTCTDTNTDNCWSARCSGVDNQCVQSGAPAVPLAQNTDCDDGTADAECKKDVCDAAGNCVANGGNLGSGTACTDLDPGDCGIARCNASGSCNQTAAAQPNTYECRPASDPNEPCDLPEFCDGSTFGCPGDLVASGTVCHTTVELCDVDELCDGVFKTCPADQVAASGTVCHALGGNCDIEELCDGVSPACPTDEVIASGTLCHSATTVCDVDDYCDGVGKICVDDKRPTTYQCRQSFGVCDPAEFCDGINNGCPQDAKSTAVCGPATGPCDLVEYCDGINNDCPADEFASAGAPCDDGDPCIENSTCDDFGNCTGGIRVCIDAGVLPDTSVPDTSVPDTTLPDTAGTDTTGYDASLPDRWAPDLAMPDTARPDTARPDLAGTDTLGIDTAVGDAGVEDGPAAEEAGTGIDVYGRPRPNAPPIDSAPGCGCAAREAGGAPPALGLALVALGLLRRRRR